MAMDKSKCEVRKCKHYKGTIVNKSGIKVHYCNMFYEGIPEDISYGDNEHLIRDARQTRRGTFELPNRNIVEPCPVELMGVRRLFSRDCICATLRNIYEMTDDEEIKFWCRISLTMAKNMTLSLLEYKEMLLELGVDVAGDRSGEWQERPKSLYRGKKGKMPWPGKTTW
jgi:hypothetical protein